jgi:hypothetical protein
MVLERLWLDTACLYEVFDVTVMEDSAWDQVGKELWERREEWTPYFKHSLPSPDFNPGTTASGVNWRKGLPLMVARYISLLDGNYGPLIEKHNRAIAQTPQEIKP